jgi:hypothetical protein
MEIQEYEKDTLPSSMVCSSAVTGPKALTRNDKMLRQKLKKHIDEQTLQQFENEILHFIERSFSVDGEYELNFSVSNASFQVDDAGWTLCSVDDLDSSEQLCFQITNSFLRLLVHTMCRYYALQSHTVTHTDGKLVIIELPKICVDSATYNLPETTFTSYFLS